MKFSVGRSASMYVVREISPSEVRPWPSTGRQMTLSFIVLKSNWPGSLNVPTPLNVPVRPSTGPM